MESSIKNFNFGNAFIESFNGKNLEKIFKLAFVLLTSPLDYLKIILYFSNF